MLPNTRHLGAFVKSILTIHWRLEITNEPIVTESYYGGQMETWWYAANGPLHQRHLSLHRIWLTLVECMCTAKPCLKLSVVGATEYKCGGKQFLVLLYSGKRMVTYE